MATLGEREKTYKLIHYPLNVRNFLCRAAELQRYRAWTVSERTADCFSHSSLFYWYTIRQIIGQSTCLSTAFMPCVLNRTNLASVQIIVPKCSSCNSLCFPPKLFSSPDDNLCRGKAGRQEHSLKHMSANMAVNFKSNLFSRRELRKIDVHISSINGFHNSLAWWTGASQSLSSKLWQVHSQFSQLIDNQILPVSMSCVTRWSEQTLLSGERRGEKAAMPALQSVTAQQPNREAETSNSTKLSQVTGISFL